MRNEGVSVSRCAVRRIVGEQATIAAEVMGREDQRAALRELFPLFRQAAVAALGNQCVLQEYETSINASSPGGTRRLVLCLNSSGPSGMVRLEKQMRSKPVEWKSFIKMGHEDVKNELVRYVRKHCGSSNPNGT
jgi:hypothetical protein